MGNCSPNLDSSEDMTTTDRNSAFGTKFHDFVLIILIKSPMLLLDIGSQSPWHRQAPATDHAFFRHQRICSFFRGWPAFVERNIGAIERAPCATL